MKSGRVSIDTPPLYVPFVWHCAHFALSTGTISCAKSTFGLASCPLPDVARVRSAAKGMQEGKRFIQDQPHEAGVVVSVGILSGGAFVCNGLTCMAMSPLLGGTGVPPVQAKTGG